MVGIQFAVTAFSMGFLAVVTAVMSHLAFSGPSRVLTAADDASAAD